MKSFRCTSFNAGRTFLAEDFGAAASRVADSIARKADRRATAWTLHHESSSPDHRSRHYATTAAIPTKQAGEARVVGDFRFTVHAA